VIVTPRASRSSDSLATYRRKRDFARTPEPAGAHPAADERRRFVVQRHRASRLHYDFRLEIDGVLVSWAVPKGPTLDPKVRRGAFHVEDHPIEYIDFEGVIPSKSYGGGDVIVWDAGTWAPGRPEDEKNPRRSVDSGEIHFDLDGDKLRGRFVLVRTKVDGSGKEQWLLLHKHDDFASSGWDAEDHPKSVLSGRTNDEVKADPDKLWRSDLPASRAAVVLKSDAVAEVGADELAELDDFGNSGTWHVFGRELRIGNLDRAVIPGRGRTRPVTKRELLRYTAQVAPTVLPQLTRRALTTRTVAERAPDWLPRWHEPRQRNAPTLLVVDEPAALLWAVNAGTVEWRATLASVDAPKQPDVAVVELAGSRWRDVLAAARLYHAALDHLDITAWPVITGDGGIDVRIPIVRSADRSEVAAWLDELAASVRTAAPELPHPGAGTDRRDALVPYSARTEPGAPVVTPLDWDDLDDPAVRPDRISVRSALDHMADRRDLLHDMQRGGSRLPRLR
jgi:bifunctional non-homologous end joining protein LigD